MSLSLLLVAVAVVNATVAAETGVAAVTAGAAIGATEVLEEKRGAAVSEGRRLQEAGPCDSGGAPNFDQCDIFHTDLRNGESYAWNLTCNQVAQRPRLTFNTFSVEANFDTFNDAASADGDPALELTGDALRQTIIGTSGSSTMVVQYVSDASRLGDGFSASFMCTCPFGMGGSGEACVPCAEGGDIPFETNECTSCPPGRADSDSDPSTPCEDCAAGRFSTTQASTQCDACPAASAYSPPGSSSSSSCGGCNPHKYDTSQCLYTKIDHAASMLDAEAICDRAGGNLASVHSADDETAILAALGPEGALSSSSSTSSAGGRAWIGLHSQHGMNCEDTATQVTAAELSQLQDQTRTLMYGPTLPCNTFDGIIQDATAHSDRSGLRTHDMVETSGGAGAPNFEAEHCDSSDSIELDEATQDLNGPGSFTRAEMQHFRHGAGMGLDMLSAITVAAAAAASSKHQRRSLVWILTAAVAPAAAHAQLTTDEQEFECQAMSGTRSGYVVGNDAATTVSGLELGSECESGYARISGQSSLSHAIFRHTTAWWSEDWKFRVLFSDMFDENMAPGVSCNSIGGDFEFEGCEPLCARGSGNRTGIKTAFPAATTISRLGTVQCDDRSAVGVATVLCPPNGSYVFGGCEQKSCVAGSGVRTGYDVESPLANTVAGLGEVLCAAGYTGFTGIPETPSVQCTIPGGNFEFEGCEEPMCVSNSGNHTGFIVEYPAATTASGLGELTCDQSATHGAPTTHGQTPQASSTGSVVGGLVLDLVGSDYTSGSSSWPSRAGAFFAAVPASVMFEEQQRAFQFVEHGETIAVGIATNPTVYEEVTYEVWVKTESPLPNLAWVVSQSPEYGWSRALAINDDRLGYVGITVGESWDSGLGGSLGQAPIGEWLHVVGTWLQDGPSTVYLNGAQGNIYAAASNGGGFESLETLHIGGAGTNVTDHNSPMLISDARVYNRALSSEEATTLYNEGRRSRAEMSQPTVVALCSVPNGSFIFSGCDDNVCIAGSGDRTGYAVDDPLATTVAGLGRVRCAADFVGSGPKAACTHSGASDGSAIVALNFTFSGCDCRPGTHLVGTACVLCETGTFATASACEMCAAGQVDHDADSATECIPCSSGRFSSITGVSTNCHSSCPPGTSCPPGSTLPTDCHRCLSGHYASPGRLCVSCYDHLSQTTSDAPACSAFGCMDPWATNFNQSALVADATCQYDCGLRNNNTDCEVIVGHTWTESSTLAGMGTARPDRPDATDCTNGVDPCVGPTGPVDLIEYLSSKVYTWSLGSVLLLLQNPSRRGSLVLMPLALSSVVLFAEADDLTTSDFRRELQAYEVDEREFECQAMTGTRSGYVIGNAVATTVSGLELGSECESGYARISGQSSISHRIFRHTTAWWSEDWKFRVQFSDMFDENMVPSVSCNTTGGDFEFEGCEPLCASESGNRTGITTAFPAATTISRLGAVQCDDRSAVGAATVSCVVSNGGFVFGGCEQKSCVAGSGVRTGYDVENPHANTVAGLGEILCAAGYSGIPRAPSAQCITPGGNFEFEGCEDPMCVSNSGNHTGFVVEYPAATTASGLGELTCDQSATHGAPTTHGQTQASSTGSVVDGLVLDLVGSDYTSGSSSWPSRAGAFFAAVPASVMFEEQQRAFQFVEHGETISVDIATNPTVYEHVTYEVWVQAEHALPNLAYVVSQSPEYGWSRALAINDDRVGYVGITVGESWDSGLGGSLGQAPLGEWLHVVGTWQQDGPSTVYLNGAQGNVFPAAANGGGFESLETLNIGGGGTNVSDYNSPMLISDVRVYNRALSSGEVTALYNEGRRSRAEMSEPTVVALCPAPNGSFIFSGCDDNVCIAGSGDRTGYVVDEPLATTVAGFGQVRCAADFVGSDPKASCLWEVLAEDGVTVLNTNHRQQGDSGKYFYFSAATWTSLFGAAPAGVHNIIQMRGGAEIWSGAVIVWDNQNGVHGRRDLGAAPSQWQAGDVITAEGGTGTGCELCGTGCELCADSCSNLGDACNDCAACDDATPCNPYAADWPVACDGDRCDETTFPDLDHSRTGTNGTCGDCKVLVNRFDSVYQSSCAVYCASMGRTCVGAWKESADTCRVEEEWACDTPAALNAGTSNAICECGDNTAAVELTFASDGSAIVGPGVQYVLDATCDSRPDNIALGISGCTCDYVYPDNGAGMGGCRTTDRHGNVGQPAGDTWNSPPSASAADCRALCDADATCASYEYNVRFGRHIHCELHTMVSSHSSAYDGSTSSYRCAVKASMLSAFDNHTHCANAEVGTDGCSCGDGGGDGGFTFSGCDCRPGTRLVGTACVPCETGTFATASACEMCAAGQVDHDADSATECVPCSSGRFSSIAGVSTVCHSSCPADASCPPGSTLPTDCHRCLSGHYSTPGGPCVSCYDHLSRTTSDAPVCSAFGCMDPWATNFNQSALVADGTCQYNCGQILVKVEAGEIDICDAHEASWIEDGSEWALRRDSMDANSVNMCLHRKRACSASLTVPAITTNRVGIRLPLIEVPDLSTRTNTWTANIVAADFNDDGTKDMFLYGIQLEPGAHNQFFLSTTEGGRLFDKIADGPWKLTGSPSEDAAAGDFNGDGALDLAVVTGGVVRLFFGDGYGEFAIGSWLNTSGVAFNLIAPDHKILAEDFDGDGNVDIYLKGGGMLFGRGSGMFEGQSSSALDESEGRPIVGDFNGDGFIDLLMVPSPRPSVFLNDGRGNFTEVSDSGIGSVTGSGTTADFNGDGALDFYSWGPNHRLSYNTGNGTFYHLPGELGAMHTGDAVAGDMNSDGLPDLYVGRYSGGLSLLLNDGHGGFAEVTEGEIITDSIGCSAANSVIFDANGDGVPDLYMSFLLGVNRLFLGDTVGQLKDVTSPDLARTTGVPGTNRYLFPLVADFNSDGADDLFISTMAPHDRLYLSDGNGELLEVTDRTPGSITAETDEPFACVADFDNDGNADILRGGTWRLYSSGWSPYVMFWGDGTGSFTREELVQFGAHPGRGIAWPLLCEDLNEDGLVDIMVPWWVLTCHVTFVVDPEHEKGTHSSAEAGIDNQMFLGDGTGRFTEVTEATIPSVGGAVSHGGSSTGIVSADFNNDDRNDLYVQNTGAHNELYFAVGGGGFVAVTDDPVVTTILPITHGSVAADFNHDGWIDLYVAIGGWICWSTPGQNALFLNDGTGRFVEVEDDPSVIDSGGTVHSIGGDWNGDGFVDLYSMSDTDENMLFLGNGDGSFRKDYSSDASASAEFSRTAIMMDVNGDGVSDLFTSNCCEFPQHLFSFRYCKDGEASPPLEWHHRPGYDCPRDSSQVTGTGHSHGHDRASEFASRAEAEAACRIGCFGIYDDGCDDAGPWKLCTAPASRWNRTVDAAAGCAFELKRPRECYKCPSYAVGYTKHSAFECEFCPAGRVGPPGITGIGDGESFNCIQCVPGKFRNLTDPVDECRDCAPGLYAEGGSSRCHECSYPTLPDTWETGGQLASSCIPCAAGLGPSNGTGGQAGCVECTGNTFSAFGTCEMCAGRASQDHTACLDCPLNMVADPPELGCRCKSGYYDLNAAGPLLCYDRTTSFDSLYPMSDDDRTGWFRYNSLAEPIDSENNFCQECPSEYVDCLYESYAGRPLLKPGYATSDGPGWFERGTRVIFECPVEKVACLGERLADMSGTSDVDTNDVDMSDTSAVIGSHAACGFGYDGVICAVCAETYAMKPSGCTECEDWTTMQIIMVAVFIVMLIAAVVSFRIFHKRHHLSAKTMILISELAPDLVGDFKVFIGMYQVLTSMGATLEIIYPPQVESLIAAVRSMANFDMFSLPGLSCVLDSSVIGKFWFSASLPPGIILFFGIGFYLRRRRTHNLMIAELGDQWNSAEWEKFKVEHDEDASQDFVYSPEENQWIKAEATEGQEIAASKSKDAASESATSAIMKRHAIETAHDKTASISWAFLLTFLVYPSVCTNVFNIFHCFAVGVDDDGGRIAYIMSDFRYQCTGVMRYASGSDHFYPFHFWSAMLFVLLYAIGIPVFCAAAMLKYCHIDRILSCGANKMLEQKQGKLSGRSLFEEMCTLETAKDTVLKTDGCTGFTFEGPQSEYDGEMLVSFIYRSTPIEQPVDLRWQTYVDEPESAPSALKQLYKDYRPEHCMWEVYQLLQKVILCGLLGFVSRGSLVQASLGLLVTELVLLGFMRTMPFNDFRTNFLAIMGQVILVISYFSTILLKIDLVGERLTHDDIGLLMTSVHVPMAMYFVYDLRQDVKEHLEEAAVLAAQLVEGAEEQEENLRTFENPLDGGNDDADER